MIALLFEPICPALLVACEAVTSIIRAIGRRLWVRRLPTLGAGLFDFDRASGANILEAAPIAGKDRLQLCDALPSQDGDVDVARFIFDADGDARDFLGRQDGRS